MALDLSNPRTRYLVRNAVRWHLTSFDATNRGEDADGIREHGWSASEQKIIDGVMTDPARLRKVLLAWIAFDEKKPAIMQNERNRDDLSVLTGLFDDGGNFVGGFEKLVTLRLLDDTLNRAGSGLSVKSSFPVHSGKYMVRMVVHDSEGRLMASESSLVQIP